MSEEKKGPGFVVKDKRLFAEGDPPAEKEQAAPISEEKPKLKEDEQNNINPEKEFNYPPINFTNFVLSLSTSALFHFGDFPDPAGGKTEKNLPAAKQTIDILDMLNENKRQSQ
jgi:hypothetical protein